jgi:hypothetical protein
MEFFNYDQVRPTPGLPIFRQSSISELMGMAIYMAFLFAACCFAYSGFQRHWGTLLISIPILLLLGVLAYAIQGRFFSSLKKSNWLVAMTTSNVLIKFRSFCNWRLPVNDLQIIELPFDEIGLAYPVKVTTVTKKQNSNCTAYHYNIFLELSTPSETLAQLEDLLKAERAKRVKGGFSTIYYPVSIKDNLLQIKFPGYTSKLARKAIAQLHLSGIKTQSLQKVRYDYTQIRDPSKVDDQIIEMIEQGKKLAAIQLMQGTYKMTLTEAKRFVDDLLYKNE